MKQRIYISRGSLWLIFPLILTMLLTFCFMTCSNKALPEQGQQKQKTEANSLQRFR